MAQLKWTDTALSSWSSELLRSHHQSRADSEEQRDSVKFQNWPDSSHYMIKKKSKQLCCKKDRLHGFYNHEFLLHVPIVTWFLIQEYQTWCTPLFNWRLLSHLVSAFLSKFNFQEIKVTSLLWMLTHSLLDQLEHEVLWSQCANQMNPAKIIKVDHEHGIFCISQVT